jgi:hypothetical protein
MHEHLQLVESLQAVTEQMSRLIEELRSGVKNSAEVK